MNTYHVYLRKGGMVIVTALRWVEKKREGRIYFDHGSKEALEESFFYLRDVSGIHVANQGPPELTINALKRDLKSLRRKPARTK